ncbi:hypothetical protein A2223_04580 [Candidatus Falkowbacteria bacterium RIFOXYA2_FULL_35_8]|uniref:Uncharacterized protein n=1 Tax=Candidatus Falkowbacteria bacterium RIFOXYC2_FULL_36_12 TaxID=1798002 RepID=A0A1F5SWH7_9BACT|nr:MAG: hypothetical protein A2300_00725 [Candidatus Falkowbacteria bacterium RIFOXYB2_FULL_35_7]OGF30866.1 MAG: hypothetical protein A2478_00220 [Candidatus Falkowbacteria bacterium RIFOXYC2_FULL_36_12]OGF34245.1 MAG: hypothetical protein A2223_04580 [Candidatus Falkowbacteria bacterium RIFOXYA2_FULL_35_8]
MQKIVVQCGCGKVVQTLQKEDGQVSVSKKVVSGDCKCCSENGGDYTKSPFWRDDTDEKFVQAQKRKHDDDEFLDKVAANCGHNGKNGRNGNGKKPDKKGRGGGYKVRSSSSMSSAN